MDQGPGVERAVQLFHRIKRDASLYLVRFKLV